jgi:hypothetical protein
MKSRWLPCFDVAVLPPPLIGGLLRHRHKDQNRYVYILTEQQSTLIGGGNDRIVKRKQIDLSTGYESLPHVSLETEMPECTRSGDGSA